MIISSSTYYSILHNPKSYDWIMLCVMRKQVLEFGNTGWWVTDWFSFRIFRSSVISSFSSQFAMFYHSFVLVTDEACDWGHLFLQLLIYFIFSLFYDDWRTCKCKLIIVFIGLFKILMYIYGESLLLNNNLFLGTTRFPSLSDSNKILPNHYSGSCALVLHCEKCLIRWNFTTGAHYEQCLFRCSCGSCSPCYSRFVHL